MIDDLVVAGSFRTFAERAEVFGERRAVFQVAAANLLARKPDLPAGEVVLQRSDLPRGTFTGG